MSNDIKIPADPSKLKILIFLLIVFGVFLIINGIGGCVSGDFMILWTAAGGTLQGDWKYFAGFAYSILGVALIYAAVVEKCQEINSTKYHLIGFSVAIVVFISGLFGRP
jgi:hypothetical protein